VFLKKGVNSKYNGKVSILNKIEHCFRESSILPPVQQNLISLPVENKKGLSLSSPFQQISTIFNAIDEYGAIIQM
jgi:hypothetical protein